MTIPQPTGAAHAGDPAPVERPPLRRAGPHSLDMPLPLLAGVCSGLSVHLGLPVKWVRIAMVALTVCLIGAGALLYLWFVVMVPRDEGEANVLSSRLSAGLARVGVDRTESIARNQLFLIGALLIGGTVLVWILTSTQTVSFVDILGLVFILAGLGMVWSQGGNIQAWRSGRFVLMVPAGLLSVTIGIVVLLAKGDPVRLLLKGGLIGIVIVVVLVATMVPLWLRSSSELSAAREQQVRDAERADIAAHIHDSVLQTLTLIRAGANDPVRVRSLALAQERELRAWLYTGTSRTSDSFAEALREAVGQVEATHGVPVDLVTVGDVYLGGAEMALVSATAEAVKNAVRHGAPPVTVYSEAGRDTVDVFVKDSGGGFDLASIPEDRHGVRGSIIGRTERAGGSVEYRTLPTGTEVHLRVPRSPAPDGSPM